MHRKTPVPEACSFIKKEILAQVFSCEFCEISKNTFYYRISLVAASAVLWVVEKSLEDSTNLKVKTKFMTVTAKSSSSQIEELNFNHSRPNPGRREKSKLNFHFHTSLWCLKRFHDGLKGLHKTFWGTTKKCENKNL